MSTIGVGLEGSSTGGIAEARSSGASFVLYVCTQVSAVPPAQGRSRATILGNVLPDTEQLLFDPGQSFGMVGTPVYHQTALAAAVDAAVGMLSMSGSPRLAAVRASGAVRRIMTGDVQHEAGLARWPLARATGLSLPRRWVSAPHTLRVHGNEVGPYLQQSHARAIRRIWLYRTATCDDGGLMLMVTVVVEGEVKRSCARGSGRTRRLTSSANLEYFTDDLHCRHLLTIMS